MRSLATRPVRTAVLACGFGFGIAVMAALLGVGDVILEQAHSPVLQGGGDVVVFGRFGSIENGRFLITSILARRRGLAVAAAILRRARERCICSRAAARRRSAVKRRHSEPRARGRRSARSPTSRLDRQAGRPGVVAPDAGDLLRSDGPIPSDSADAGVRGVVGRMAVLQRAHARGRAALLSDVHGRPGDGAWTAAGGRPASARSRRQNDDICRRRNGRRSASAGELLRISTSPGAA